MKEINQTRRRDSSTERDKVHSTERAHKPLTVDLNGCPRTGCYRLAWFCFRASKLTIPYIASWNIKVYPTYDIKV